MRLLVFGLPGSGKTTFARQLSAGYAYFNADEVRKMFNDWDFSPTGRTRQAQRMGCLSSLVDGHAIVDFICPFDDDRHEYDVKNAVDNCYNVDNLSVTVNGERYKII